jgi:hypothetical protein
MFPGREPDAGGRDDASELVAAGPAAENTRPGLDGARPELRAGEVHDGSARSAGVVGRPPEVVQHAIPGIRAVMRAVDAHAVHAGDDQVADEGVLAGGLDGHRDHDAHGAT